MKAHITMRKTIMKNNTTKTYYIYKLVNEANDKVYIGQTRNPQSRFSKCQYRGRKIKDAIESIGWDKFHFNLLAQVNTEEEANRLEEQFITEYDSVNSGYNSNYKTHEHRINKRSAAARSRQRATMSTSRWYWNPKTDETIRIMKGGLVPNGFVLGRGGKKKSVRGHSLWMKVDTSASKRAVGEIA